MLLWIVCVKSFNFKKTINIKYILDIRHVFFFYHRPDNINISLFLSDGKRPNRSDFRFSLNSSVVLSYIDLGRPTATISISFI